MTTSATPETVVLLAIRTLAEERDDWAVSKIRLAVRTNLTIEKIDRAIFKLEEQGVRTVRRYQGRASVYTLTEGGESGE